VTALLIRWRRLKPKFEYTLASSRAVVQVLLAGFVHRRLGETNR
jgi:hypothetical protein